MTGEQARGAVGGARAHEHALLVVRFLYMMRCPHDRHRMGSRGLMSFELPQSTWCGVARRDEGVEHAILGNRGKDVSDRQDRREREIYPRQVDSPAHRYDMVWGPWPSPYDDCGAPPEFEP